jgi:hypothetical protein
LVEAELDSSRSVEVRELPYSSSAVNFLEKKKKHAARK